MKECFCCESVDEFAGDRDVDSSERIIVGAIPMW